jgi:hypothetical protein
METQTIGDALYYIAFFVLIFFLVVLFVAKLKFDINFDKREERRRMLSYSKVKLTPTEEGLSRNLKVKKVVEEPLPVADAVVETQHEKESPPPSPPSDKK